MPVGRPKRTTELILEENDNENQTKDAPVDIEKSLTRLKLFDSTPVNTAQPLRRISSTISKWAPKRTQELQAIQSDSGDEVTDPQLDNKLVEKDSGVTTSSDLLKNSEPLSTIASLTSLDSVDLSQPTAISDEPDDTPANLPPPPRFMHRSSMTKLKLRGRAVLGLISNQDGDKRDRPGIFKNIKSPDMRASMDVSRLSDSFSTSTASSCKESPINLNTQPQYTKSLSTSLLKLKEVLNSETKEIAPFTLDVLKKEYYVTKVLGKGGTGTVFVGTVDDQQFAVKVTQLNGDEERISGFYREVSLMRRLKDNKYVIQIVDDALVGDCAFIVMEKGEMDLYRHLLTYTTEIPLYIIARWFHDMVSAVQTIHQLGIIHADLKPANFLVMSNGDLKLTDFGISKMKQRLSESILPEQDFVMAGTLNFLCPEAVTNIMKQKPSSITEAADIWSLGVIFYYLLYKELPFGRISDKREKMLAIADAERALKFPNISKYYPELFREMCQACLQHNSRLRPKAAEFFDKFPLQMIIPIKNEDLNS